MTDDYKEAGKELRLKDKLNLEDMMNFVFVIGDFFHTEFGEGASEKCRTLLLALGIDGIWCEQALKILKERLEDENY